MTGDGGDITLNFRPAEVAALVAALATAQMADRAGARDFDWAEIEGRLNAVLADWRRAARELCEQLSSCHG